MCGMPYWIGTVEARALEKNLNSPISGSLHAMKATAGGSVLDKTRPVEVCITTQDGHGVAFPRSEDAVFRPQFPPEVEITPRRAVQGADEKSRSRTWLRSPKPEAAV